MVVTNNDTNFQLKGRRQHDNGDVTESRSSYRQSGSDDNFPIHYSSIHCKFPDQLQTQQQQERSSMDGSRSTSPREHQPQYSSTIGKTSATNMAIVTPSPPSKGSPGVYDAIANIDDDNGAWRKHGKLFRANIVLTDEGIEGNSFSLSDSCTIERYYRVADRVLEQFLSSNISERNELIESYLVGNRLFKFLSVVLPTHNQYFSPDPKLTSLRNRSESQLMELLDYMHEIELMIDEMEYNRYILNDLTPSELKFDERGEISTSITNSISSDDGDTNGDTNGEFLGGSKDIKRSDISRGRSSTIATSVATSETLNQDDGDDECLGQRVSSSSSSHQMFYGGNVKVAVQAIEASHQIQGNSTKTNCQSQRKMLKERVAAVVNASNNLDGCNNSIKSMRSVSSSVAKSAPSPILHRSMDKSKIEMTRKFQTHAHNNTNEIDNQGRPPKPQLNQPGIPIKLTKQPCRQQQRHIDESVSKSFNSWDEDFSHFNAFSDINQDADPAAFDPKRSHIDLLLQDPFPSKWKSSEIMKPLPKIKEPPVSHSRSVWAQAQVNAARLISPLNGIDTTTNEFESELSPALSDCSSDIFYSLEDPEPSPVTTKIEERMERAALTSTRSRNTLRNSKVAFDLTDYEDLLLMEAPNRKLLHQFKGCVKFLLD